MNVNYLEFNKNQTENDKFLYKKKKSLYTTIIF